MISHINWSVLKLTLNPHALQKTQSMRHPAGLKPGEGELRIRWREYRLRYDIFGSEVVLHSFRHRKDAY